MKFGKNHIRMFAILAFDSNSVRGCVFRFQKTHYVPERYMVTPLDSVSPAVAWKKMLKNLGRGQECPLYLTGALNDGYFFRFNSIELTPKMRRESLEMELSQHIPIIPEAHQIQFFANDADDSGNVPVNVYAIPGSSLERLAAMLTQSAAKADEFIYPLLAIQAGDPPVDSSRIDANFGFEESQWRPIEKDKTTNLESWENIFSKDFDLPKDHSFAIEEYFECLLLARLVIKPQFKEQNRAFTMLPKEFRPRRLRGHLRVAIALVLLVLVNYLWLFFGIWHENYTAYQNTLSTKRRLTNENNLLSRKIKVQEKGKRELLRMVALNPGEADVISKLAAFTRELPSDVLVATLRWSESSCDMTLQSESESLDIPAIIGHLPFWEIGQLQQRRMGDTVSMITLKLKPVGDK